MNKKKNGFTLIELLVTIAIMLSILGIAIVSFVTISNRKKEEAKGLVDEQIMTAGKQFFTSNEYLFEGMDSSATGKIYLKDLVERDFLNKVTDPTTGEPMNPCTKIEVQRNVNGGWDAKIAPPSESEEDGECQYNNSIEISEQGAPKFEITYSGGKKNNKEWYNEKVTVIAKKDGNIPIANFSSCKDSHDCTNFNEDHGKVDKVERDINENTLSTEFCFQAKGFGGATRRKCSEPVKMDIDNPVCDKPIVSKKPNGDWYTSSTGAPDVTFNAKDNLSGFDGNNKLTASVAYKGKDFDPGTTTLKETFTDQAGNPCTSDSLVINYDPNPPSCAVVVNNPKDNNWYNETKNLSLEVSEKNLTWEWKDSKTGMGEQNKDGNYNCTKFNPLDKNYTCSSFLKFKVDKSVSGIHNITASVTDKAGNKVECTPGIVKIDTAPPVCDVKVASANDSKKVNGWFNGNTGKPTITFNAKDQGTEASGIAGASTSTNTNISQGKNNYSKKFTDNAGNSVNCNTDVAYDSVKPSCKVVAKSPKSNNWYNSETPLKLTSNEKYVSNWNWRDDKTGSNGSYNSGCNGTECTNSNFKANTTQGVHNITASMTDEAGNSANCTSGIVKIDTTPPECDIREAQGNNTGKGLWNSGHKVLWWTRDVTLNLITWDAGQNYDIGTEGMDANGCSQVKRKGLSTSEYTYNSTTSLKYTSNTWNIGGVPHYGQVEDNAGNVGKCYLDIGVEKSATIRIDTAKMANTTSYSKGGKVFNGNGTCSFGKCSSSSIMCRVGGKQCPTAYFARACRYVGEYNRYFLVDAPSLGKNVSIVLNNANNCGKANASPDCSKRDLKGGSAFVGQVARKNPGCEGTSAYSYYSCGSNAGNSNPAFTGHDFQYYTPLGTLASNTEDLNGGTDSGVRLYVEYNKNCGY